MREQRCRRHFVLYQGLVHWLALLSLVLVLLGALVRVRRLRTWTVAHHHNW
jgi:hypothetical protein